MLNKLKKFFHIHKWIFYYGKTSDIPNADSALKECDCRKCKCGIDQVYIYRTRKYENITKN